jgi:prepilin-type N-terminal cleavage/methylation domain-containing protein
MKNMQLNPRAAGFTLVEVVFALAILAMALFGMISVISYSSRSNTVARERMLAMRAAEKQMEIMKNMAATQPLNAIFKTYSATPTFQVYNDMYLQDPSKPATDPVNALVPAISPNMGASGGPTPAGSVSFNLVGAALVETGSGTFLGRLDAGGVPVDVDMDGDGFITGNDQSNNPNLGALPVKIAINWIGVKGPGQIILTYIFTK